MKEKWQEWRSVEKGKGTTYSAHDIEIFGFHTRNERVDYFQCWREKSGMTCQAVAWQCSAKKEKRKRNQGADSHIACSAFRSENIGLDPDFPLCRHKGCFHPQRAFDPMEWFWWELVWLEPSGGVWEVVLGAAQGGVSHTLHQWDWCQFNLLCMCNKLFSTVCGRYRTGHSPNVQAHVLIYVFHHCIAYEV